MVIGLLCFIRMVVLGFSGSRSRCLAFATREPSEQFYTEHGGAGEVGLKVPYGITTPSAKNRRRIFAEFLSSRIDRESASGQN
jgi:hypothetical protein